MVSITYRYFDVANSEKRLVFLANACMPLLLPNGDLSIVCSNDSRIKCLDLSGSNFLDIVEECDVFDNNLTSLLVFHLGTFRYQNRKNLKRFVHCLSVQA